MIVTVDITEWNDDMMKDLIKRKIYKSRSEVVRDAVRQLAFKYGIVQKKKLKK